MDMIGKKVIVRANVAGVHAGTLISLEGTQAVIEGAYRLWRIYTRDKSGSLSDIAANGLMPDKDHQIGARLKSVLIENPPGLEIDECTEDAFASIEKYAEKHQNSK